MLHLCVPTGYDGVNEVREESDVSLRGVSDCHKPSIATLPNPRYARFILAIHRFVSQITFPSHLSEIFYAVVITNSVDMVYLILAPVTVMPKKNNAVLKKCAIITIERNANAPISTCYIKTTSPSPNLYT